MPEFQPPKRLLIRGTNWLGDAVMTTPALIRLREKLTGTHITVLTPAKLADLYSGHPAVDSVLEIASSESVWSVSRRIRSGDFDATLLFPASHRTALEVFLAGVPFRAGLASPFRTMLLTKAVNERPGKIRMRKLSNAEVQERVSQQHGHDKGSDIQAKWPKDAHQVHDYLYLASVVFDCSARPVAPLLRIANQEVEAVVRRFSLSTELPILTIAPGAQYGPAKKWPEGNFIQAAAEIAGRMECSCLLLGTTEDLDVCARISRALDGRFSGGTHNLAGHTNLRELMAVLRMSAVLLGNDSGTMHLAAALGTRVVTVFGSTSPELTGPYSTEATQHTILKANAPCSPCFRRDCPIDLRCLKAVRPEDAVQHVLDAMAGRP